MTLPKSVKADSMSCFSSDGAVLNEAALRARQVATNKANLQNSCKSRYLNSGPVVCNEV